MSGYDTSHHAIARPTGPRARQSIRDPTEQRYCENGEMPPKKKSNKPQRKNNLSNKSQSSDASDSPSPLRDQCDVRNCHKTLFVSEQKSINESVTYDETSFESSLNNSDRQSVDTTQSDDFCDSNESFELSKYENESLPYTELSREINPDNKNSQNQKNWIPTALVFIVMIIAVILYFAMSMHISDAGKTRYEYNLTEGILGLKGLFPSQDKKIWGKFASGIADVRSMNHTPAIFLLLATHDETTNCLAKKVAEVARSALKGTGKFILTPDMLENNVTKVFTLMEDRVRQSKAVVVLDLLSIQPEAIKAFHDICDQYTPLVKEALYVFTMKSREHEGATNPMDLAEQQLTNSFSRFIKEDILKPLIVRITNGEVISIRAEENSPCSK